MNDPEKQRRMYQFLAVVFGVAGVVWVVYGVFSHRFILYPLIGVANLVVAYHCRKAGA